MARLDVCAALCRWLWPRAESMCAQEGTASHYHDSRIAVLHHVDVLANLDAELWTVKLNSILAWTHTHHITVV